MWFINVYSAVPLKYSDKYHDYSLRNIHQWLAHHYFLLLYYLTSTTLMLVFNWLQVNNQYFYSFSTGTYYFPKVIASTERQYTKYRSYWFQNLKNEFVLSFCIEKHISLTELLIDIFHDLHFLLEVFSSGVLQPFFLVSCYFVLKSRNIKCTNCTKTPVGESCWNYLNIIHHCMSVINWKSCNNLKYK